MHAFTNVSVPQLWNMVFYLLFYSALYADISFRKSSKSLEAKTGTFFHFYFSNTIKTSIKENCESDVNLKGENKSQTLFKFTMEMNETLGLLESHLNANKGTIQRHCYLVLWRKKSFEISETCWVTMKNICLLREKINQVIDELSVNEMDFCGWGFDVNTLKMWLFFCVSCWWFIDLNLKRKKTQWKLRKKRLTSLTNILNILSHIISIKSK